MTHVGFLTPEFVAKLRSQGFRAAMGVRWLKLLWRLEPEAALCGWFSRSPEDLW